LAILTVDETAKYLKVNPQVIRRWLREKKLPGFKVGHDWRIDEADLAALIENAKGKHKITK
jgi:excisionase family DNA binding protein